ncbi:MAG: hypothetical protein CL507_04305, partial [Actinobacteria bacterium]|nr:hypothetical protein [Actinomycetota bacterium]
MVEIGAIDCGSNSTRLLISTVENGNLENLDQIKTQILKINSKMNIHIGKYEITNLNEFKKEDDYLV